MKICLIPQVSINAAYPRYSLPYVPLGLLSIAGMFSPQEHKIEVIDLTLLVRNGSIKYGRDFEKTAARLIHSKKCDLVGFSTFSACFHHTLKIATELKKISPETTIVFGGPQATFCANDILKNFPVDIIVRGEGETTFKELTGAMETGSSLANIQGISYRNGKNIIVNPGRPLIEDINTLPLPAYHLYPVYPNTKVPIEMTRGCPFHCTYCATARYWGKRTRRKSVERAFLEMRFLSNIFNTSTIVFVDDTFITNRAQVIELCHKLIKEKNEIKWRCSTRINTVNKELLKLMSKAGCTGIFYGIESGSPKIQRSIKKDIDLKCVTRTLKATAAEKIGLTASFIIGFPEETIEEIKMTLRLQDEIKKAFSDKQSIRFHILSCDVNTELSETYKKDLLYDGFHSDQAGGIYLSFDKRMLLRYKEMFLGCYYIRAKHVKREMLKYLYHFLFDGFMMAYWSSLYVSLAKNDPLHLFMKWHKAPTPVKSRPESENLVKQIYSFFASFFNGPDIPLPVRELYRHETEISPIKKTGGFDTYTVTYQYDPEITIEAIRKGAKDLQRLPKSPVMYRYSVIPAEGELPSTGYVRVRTS